MFQRHEQAKKDADSWVKDNIHYEVLMGSYAYGVHNETSDKDIYGFCIPPKDVVFPYQMSGFIYGFGSKPKEWEQFHRCYDDVDFTIFSVVKYVNSCMKNNPNLLDSLFVPTHCVCHITKAGAIIRDNRLKFLSAMVYETYKGYAYSQLRALKNKNPTSGKRKELIEKHGYDTKFAYHIVRLVDYAVQILRDGDLDMQKDKEKWKSIRAGMWTMEQLESSFYENEKTLDDTYKNTKLPSRPNETEIKEILYNTLEHHFGSLDKMVPRNNKAEVVLNEMQLLIDRFHV